MPLPSGLRRLLPRPTVIGLAVIVVAVLVLVAAAVNTMMLGPDPQLAFDCNDTSCEDPWIAARTHHRVVALWTVPAVVVGWALVGLGRPSRPTRPAQAADPADPGGWGREVFEAIAGVAVLAMVAVALGPTIIVLAFLGPIPTIMGAMIATAALWTASTLVFRRAGVGGRAAWFLAGAEVVAALGLLLVAMAWSWGLVGRDASFGGSRLPDTLGPVLVLGVVVLVPVVHQVVVAVIRRRARGPSGDPTRRDAPPDGPPSASPSRTWSWVSETVILLVLWVFLAWAASPVEAPPRDDGLLGSAPAGQEPGDPAPERMVTQ